MACIFYYMPYMVLIGGKTFKNQEINEYMQQALHLL